MKRDNMIRRWHILLFLAGAIMILFAGCGLIFPPNRPESTKLPITIPPCAACSATATPTVQPASDLHYTPTPTPTSAVQTEMQEDPTQTPTTEVFPGSALSIGPFSPFTEAIRQPNAVIKALIQGPEGMLWVITADGVSSFDGVQWVDHGDMTGLALGFDGIGRLWLVDHEGDWITAYDGELWTRYDADSGWLPAGAMYHEGMYTSVSDGVVTDARGDTWLVTVNDIRVLRGERWTLYGPEEAGFTPSDLMQQEEFGFLLSDVDMDSTGDVWVTDCAWMGPGPQGQGARWFTGESWRGQDSPVVASGCIKDVEISSDGRIWVGVDDNVWRYSMEQGWELLPHPEIFPMEDLRWGWIFDLLLDGTDAVWMSMAACGGASCDVGRSITFWVSENEWLIVGEDGVPDVAQGANDLTWGCYGSGLYAVAAGEFIAVEENLPSTCQVEADQSGRVWLSLTGESTLWYFDAPQ